MVIGDGGSMRQVARRLAVFVALALGCGGSHSLSRDEAAAPAGSERPGSACEEPAADALARIDGAPCPWELIAAADDGLRLRGLAPGGPLLEVVPPEVCAPASRCRYEGVMSPLGPLVVAALPGPEAEAPVDLWLGAAVGGERLVFARLWWDAPSVVDHTEVGPVFALTPFRCGERLVLRPQARLPEATQLTPSPTLLARAGVYEAEGDALVRRDDVGAGAEPCEPLDVALP